MIKLKYVELKNFKNYGDCRIEFSQDDEKPLTVVEGENGRGKTTLLHALAWCLTGEQAKLGSDSDPRRRVVFSANWDPAVNGKQIEVIVRVGFTVNESGSVDEYVAQRSQRIYLDPTRPTVFNATDAELDLSYRRPRNTGWVSINPGNLALNRWFPKQLKDIYFMNGDAAMSFVQSNDGSRRTEVENAIKQLLKLEFFESALAHIQNAKKKYRTRKTDFGASSELAIVEGELKGLEEQILSAESFVTERKAAQAETINNRDEVRAKLDAALEAGAGEGPELRARRDALEERWTEQVKFSSTCLEKLRTSANASDLLFMIALPTLKKAKTALDLLEQKGEIPNTLPILLESALRRKICICGADISAGTSGEAHIQTELRHSKEGSETNDTLLSLHQSMSVRTRPGVNGMTSWLDKHRDIRRELIGSDEKVDELARELSDVESKISNLPELDVRSLNATWTDLVEAVSRLELLVQQKEGELSRLKKAKNEAASKRQVLLRKTQNNDQVTWRIDTSDDLENLFQAVLDQSKTVMVDDLSQLTERYFMKMIALESKENLEAASISGVEIKRNYDIVVKSKTAMNINPADLNGASLRALTLAMLLALQELSGTKSARVIDTPLGMMTGKVKEEFAKAAIDLSDQITLLVTGAEISGLEEMFKSKAGRWYKLIPEGKPRFAGEVTVQEVH